MEATMFDRVTDPADQAAIGAEFMRQVYLAERLRQARAAGVLPIPEPDPLARRLWRRAHPEATQPR